LGQDVDGQVGSLFPGRHAELLVLLVHAAQREHYQFYEARDKCEIDLLFRLGKILHHCITRRKFLAVFCESTKVSNTVRGDPLELGCTYRSVAF